MKRIRPVFFFLLAFLILPIYLSSDIHAVELPENFSKDLESALPEGAEDFLGNYEEYLDRENNNTAGFRFTDGVGNIIQRISNQIGSILRQRVRGAASVLLVVILCSTIENFYQGSGGASNTLFLPMAGALSVTLLSAGSLDSLIGLGSKTIGELAIFSRTLLPTLAAAVAASGAVSTAAVQQVTAVFLVDLQLQLAEHLLMPLVYLYIGTITASACLPESCLSVLATGLKKTVTWILTTSLLFFTLYLSAARMISGSADAVAVKVAKTAISNLIPVVGGIISEASETVLAGAGMLKNSIGVFGTLGILAACAYPFLQLGAQYLLYKFTAFLAAAVGNPGLCRLIDGLGGAFGLVLGMTGSCALLLLIAVLASVGAVMP